MVVNWTPEKDQIILRGIFKFHEIKNSTPLLKYLAEAIGDGCTPKAVSHRLSNLRKTGQPLNKGGVTSTPKKAAPTAKTFRTPTSGRARAPPKKMTEPEVTSDESEDEEPVRSPSMNRKRARNSKGPKSYAESEADSADDEDEQDFIPTAKKIKAEPVESKAFTGTLNVASNCEEDDEEVACI